MLRSHLAVGSFPTSIVKMLFVFIICQLIFCIDFSLGANKTTPDRRHRHRHRYRHLNNEEDDSKLEMQEFQNKTTKIPTTKTTISRESKGYNDRSYMEYQYMVRAKNYIDKFENKFESSFVPNWAELNKTNLSPLRKDETRRQMWKHILETGNDLVFVKRLNSEMEKEGLNHTTFCEEIAQSYLTLKKSIDVHVLKREPKLYKEKERRKWICDPLQKKSILVFLKVIFDLRYEEIPIL